MLACAAAVVAALGAFAALAESGSPLLSPLFRYDASHDVLPDWIWDRGLPLRGHYRNLYARDSR
jgi:hypothetical protein